MDYLYLISGVVFLASTGILGGFYNKRNEGKKAASPLYTLIMIGSTFLFWLIRFCLDFEFDWNVVWYALLFAFCYWVCNTAFINALKIGSIILTSLLMQLSLIGVTLWGFFFWDTQFSFLVGIGLLLVCISLALCLYNGKTRNHRGISWKWIFYAVIAFIGNAGCSIVQRTQQIKFEGSYGNLLMVIATGIALITSLIVYLKSDKTDSVSIIKHAGYIPVFAGIANGLLNLFVIFLSVSNISPSLIYPTLAVGGLILTTVFSAFIFKEKMHWWQWLGVFLGIIAVGLLSI